MNLENGSRGNGDEGTGTVLRCVLACMRKRLSTFARFSGREYADAHVILIVPGQAVFFRSTLEDTEYYLLRYEEDTNTEGIWFSFLKFYYEEPELTYEDFLEWSEDGYIKEIGRVTLDEVEDTLIDEFGEWE